LTLSSRIFIGLGVGVAVGLFFGELVADFEMLGDLYVGLQGNPKPASFN